MRKHVVCPHRHPNIACRGHDQAVESTCPVPCGRGVIAGEGSDARIKTEQEFILERGHPDGPVRITGDLHQRDLRPWDKEKTDAARDRVEATDLIGAQLGEPDHPLGVHSHTIGEKHLYTPSGCERIVAYEPGAWIKPSQG